MMLLSPALPLMLRRNIFTRSMPLTSLKTHLLRENVRKEYGVFQTLCLHLYINTCQWALFVYIQKWNLRSRRKLMEIETSQCTSIVW